MALPKSLSDREYNKFIEDSSGDVAVRTIFTDGSGDDEVQVSNGAMSTSENDPVDLHFSSSPLIDETNKAVGTYRVRANTEYYRGVSAHCECSGGTTMTIWYSNKDDPSTSSDSDWVQESGFSVTDSKDMYVSNMYEKYKWIMVKYVTTTTTNAIECDLIKYN